LTELECWHVDHEALNKSGVVQRLTNLQRLRICGLKDSTTLEVDCLLELHNLTSLSLEHVSLSRDPTFLPQLTRLVSLNLTSYDVNSFVFDSAFTAAGETTSLRELTLRATALYGYPIDITDLRRLTNLEVLDIRGFDDSHQENWPAFFLSVPNLKVLRKYPSTFLRPGQPLFNTISSMYPQVQIEFGKPDLHYKYSYTSLSPKDDDGYPENDYL